ncbi:MAG: pyridoxal-dependent decarboxylase [Chloroflexi bacterium]|nr:pyridoxal-dependent decarboxylase [Chloroflexota bacterium]
MQRCSPASLPVEPESLDRMMADFQAIILPGITHWNHPHFYAYFSNTGSAPGILAEMLIAALKRKRCISRRTSPAATELEECDATGCAPTAGSGRGLER